MKNEIIVYHGSEKVIEKPLYGYGNIHNDYGLGFYTTETINLAKEWACTATHSGYLNKYLLKVKDLNILDLSNGQYSTLHWITLLIQNRQFNLTTQAEKEAYNYLISNFNVDISSFDIIKGYRADDSYFSYAILFLDNQIGLSTLTKALKLGNLGQQIVLKSEKAFNNLTFCDSVFVKKEIYYPQRQFRELKAKEEFKNLESESLITNKDDIRLYRLIDGEIDKNDSRLR